ncbi:MAG: hypothetical protein Q8L14_39960 [Myxococcales bacterium]|nr:hypothetical protein [Myxococcales bacterium]
MVRLAAAQTRRAPASVEVSSTSTPAATRVVNRRPELGLVAAMEEADVAGGKFVELCAFSG